MNWKLLILILVAVEHGYRLLLHLVHARSAGNPTPANVADVYDAETYQRWKRYSAENSRLSVFSTLLSLALTLALLGFDVHAAVARLFPEDAFWQLAAVLLFQTLVDTAAGLPLKWVDTMVIEQKYGFNRTTVKTFVFDQLRNFLIELVISIGLMSLLMLFAPLGAWLILLFAGVVFGFALIISFLYGPVFSRIGNRFVPLEEGELRQKLEALLTSHGYRVKAIEVMDASRRTTKLNAYFTGFGSLKSIVLYDNLVNAMETDEICAVFAHELGHGLNKDVLRQQAFSLLSLVVMGAAVWFCVQAPAMHQAFGFENVNYGFAFMLLGVWMGLIQPLLSLLTNAFTRRAEYRADQQAVKEGYGKPMTVALKKLARENFAHLAPAPLLVALEYSHPPLSRRIAAIGKAMAE